MQLVAKNIKGAFSSSEISTWAIIPGDICASKFSLSNIVLSDYCTSFFAKNCIGFTSIGDRISGAGVKDTSSNKILFLLDDTDVGLIDSDNFIVTDFV